MILQVVLKAHHLELAVPGTELKVRILGELHDAEIIEDSPHDPENARLRVNG